MKFFATLLVAATFAVASAQDCDPTLLATATGSDEAKACGAATGFSAAVALKSFPTAEEAKKICVNTDCQKLLAAVTKLVPTECELAGVKIKSGLVDKFTAACSGAAAGSAETAKAGSGSGAATEEVTTPEPTTAASGADDKEEVSASSGSSAAAPAAADATKAVPTPAPTSGASTVAAATGAVVMAVAATML